MNDIYEQQLPGFRWDPPEFHQLATTEGQQEKSALPSAFFRGLPCANFVTSARIYPESTFLQSYVQNERSPFEGPSQVDKHTYQLSLQEKPVWE
jgi:hypothetical protein